MFRRARRSLPRRDEVYDPLVIAFDSSKSTVVGSFDPPADVRHCKPSASGPLELGPGTNG